MGGVGVVEREPESWCVVCESEECKCFTLGAVTLWVNGWCVFNGTAEEYAAWLPTYLAESARRQNAQWS